MYFKLLISIFVLVSNQVFAGPITRDTTITSFHPMAVDRTHCPSCSGLTRVYVNNANWGDSDCRRDAGDLFKEDDHILSILLTAWIAGKSVQLEINDTVKPIDTVCKITAAYIK